MPFLGEIKRRKVFQVAAVYLVVAWLIMQVVDVVSGPLLLPDVFARIVILVLAIGFPIALILSWAFDLTPEGVVRDQGTSVTTQSRGRGIEYVLIGLLVVAVGWILYRTEISPSEQVVDIVTEQSQLDVLPNSIAVLPLENVSPDPNDAYFAVGFHEEILSQLAKIRDLNVIARTSVLGYPGSGKSIPEIADELNVEMVMEGSVRIAGDELRVTAQLIDGATNTHLWTETYPGNLADIFTIQADIATRIAMALEAELLPDEQRSIETPLTQSPAALALYLRASSNFLLLGEPTTLPETRRAALADLNRAIELDPNFALAYARRAGTYVQSMLDPYTGDDWFSHKTELGQLIGQDANRALALDPKLGLAWAALGQVHLFSWRQAEAALAFERALELSPNDVDVLFWTARFYWHWVDRQAENFTLIQRLLALDPNNDATYYLLGMYRHVAGDYEAAIDAFYRGAELAPAEAAAAYLHVGMSNIALGDEGSGVEFFRLAESLMPQESAIGLWAHLGWCYGRAGQINDAERILLKLQALAATTFISHGAWTWAHLGVRDEVRALDEFRLAIENPAFEQISYPLELIKNNFLLDPILERSEFVELRSRVGFRE